MYQYPTAKMKVATMTTLFSLLATLARIFPVNNQHVRRIWRKMATKWGFLCLVQR